MSLRLEIADHESTPFRQALKLRQRVLRDPLGLRYSADDIAAEKNQTHLVALLGDQLVATISLVAAPDHARFRQMAVSPEHQGQGIGAALLRAAEQLAVERGFTRAELHARLAAAGFYQKAGYQFVSGEYLEVGIPHRTMAKSLA